MSIQSLEITNFQAHKRLDIKFSDTITTITGESDRGKSAILRALIWLATNRPTGDDFIRYGATECLVKAVVDGHTIERVKGKKNNSYILDGVEYKALKTDVPEDVCKVLNIDKNNIQQQFDPIFWFSQTPGEVGKNLNQIVNLEIIDNVMYELQSKSKNAKAEIGVLDSLIAEQEEQLQNEELVNKICEVAERVEKFQEQHWQNEIKINKLGEALQRAESLVDKLDHARSWQELYERLDGLFKEFIANNNSIRGLEGCISQIESINAMINKAELPPQLMELVNRTIQEDNRLQDMRKRWKKLFNIVDDIEDTQKDLDKHDKEYKQAKDKLDQIIENNVCPLCGRGGDNA